MAKIFKGVMIINPSLEVYLLDIDGKILSFYASEKRIILAKIDTRPIWRFINKNGNLFVTGDDPRHPESQKVFSAAPIKNNGIIVGFIYVVLASEEYENASNYLRSDYLLQIGTKTMVLSLIFAFTIGLIIIRLITKNLQKVIEVMQKFKQGDINARIKIQSTGDIKELSGLFNEMADILTRNIEKVNEVEVLRRELVANISHDLRTPISIIHGYVETLLIKDKTLSQAEIRRYLNIIYKSIDKLEILVNELFELSKLEANQVQPNKEPFFISELVSDITNKYQLIANNKSITLNTKLSKEQSPVYGDVSLIERVMQNLIDNALKFTPNGGRILIQTNKAKSGIEVCVSDSGIGIPKQEKELVFGRYYKGHGFKKFQKNTGLGLAIAKKILDLHDSSLVLQSEENQGTSFAFELPLYQ